MLVIAVAGLFFLSGKQSGGAPDSSIGFSFKNFFPFGNSSPNSNTEQYTASSTAGENGATNTNSASSTSYTTQSNNTSSIPRLRKISREPVAGSIVWNTGSTSVVRFVEKGTGNVYEAKSDSLMVERLTNTTLPKIIKAFWLPNASGFLAQSIETNSEIIDTSFVNLKRTGSSTPAYNTAISKLPTGIQEIAISPDGKKIFYYTYSGTGSDWFISNPDGTNATNIYSSPLKEWLISWIAPDKIFLQTKPSGETLSFAYFFNPNTKSLTSFGSGLGLKVNVQNSKNLFIASLGGGGEKAYLLDSKTGSPEPLDINTFSDKCAWAPNSTSIIYCAIPKGWSVGTYPDDWYKGVVSTEDYLEQINTQNNIYFINTDFSKESGQKIDVTNLQISPNGKSAIFTNKIDGFLWLLNLQP